MGAGAGALGSAAGGRRGGVAGAAFRRTHRLNRAQRRAMRTIEAWRTAALGGYRDVCDHCGAERLSHNSCRNRHLARDRIPIGRFAAGV